MSELWELTERVDRMQSYTMQWLDEPEPEHPPEATHLAIIVGLVLILAHLMTRRM